MSLYQNEFYIYELIQLQKNQPMDLKWNKLFIISILEISLVLTSCKKESDTVISIPASETITIDYSGSL